MTIDDYFGDWMKVLDRNETIKIIRWIKTLNKDLVCPAIKDIFKAFKLCPYNNCKIIFIGYDPYPQKGVSQGILFGNSSNTPENKLSPSLEIIKESVINFEVPHNLINFDPSLENWAKQGILMLNSALTTEIGKTGVHTKQWRPFMSKFITRMSFDNPGIIYVLFGSNARVLEPYIHKNNSIIKVEHPAYFARTGKKMPRNLWYDINNLLYSKYGEKIEWFKEELFN